MDIYILRDGKEIGPFSEETTHQMLKQGVVLINDSAWRPGMPEWIPLHDVLYPAPAAVSSESPEAFAAAVQIAPEPATAKQKAFLDYMGIETPAGIGKEQAAILVNDAMEDPKNSARVARWNDERLKLHPDLFAAELHAKKEGRAQRYFELCQTEGADVLEGVTKAHCQVLVGYLDVKAPNWDANETEGLWNYFFPAISEKFPALVREDWKGRLQYPQGPKVSADLKRRAPVAVSVHKRKGPSPIASLFKGLVLGLVILALGVGGFYVYQHPEVIDQAKAKLASLQKSGDRSSKTVQAKPVSTPVPASTPDSLPVFSGSPLAGTPTTPPAAAASSGDSAPTASSSPMGSSPSMAGANSNDAGMNSAPPMPEPGLTSSGSNTVSLFDPPPSSASTSSAGSTMENNAAAVGGLPGPKTTVVITQPLAVQLTYGKIQIPVGTQLRIIEQDGAMLKVRFQNQTVSIPASATDLGGVATPQ